MLVLIICLLLTKYSSACITQDECLSSIHNVLSTYDERHTLLEYELAKHLQEISYMLSNQIIALNSQMLLGPIACRHFLEDNTLEHYIKVLNGSCEHDHHRHVSHEVWTKFQQLNPHFFDVTDQDEVLFVCDILIAILNDFCAVIKDQIIDVKRCDFSGNFRRLFVKPWMECVVVHGLHIEH